MNCEIDVVCGGGGGVYLDILIIDHHPIKILSSQPGPGLTANRFDYQTCLIVSDKPNSELESRSQKRDRISM